MNNSAVDLKESGALAGTVTVLFCLLLFNSNSYSMLALSSYLSLEVDSHRFEDSSLLDVRSGFQGLTQVVDEDDPTGRSWNV